MAFEREVIMDVRSRVDAYDEQHLFGKTDPYLNADTAVVHSHVRLGSLDKVMHLRTLAETLSADIHLENLQQLLATFLHLNNVLNTESKDLSRFQVHNPMQPA